MFKRILVAVDESPCSARAERTATALAARTGAELLLVHVIEPRGYSSSDDVWMNHQQRREYALTLLEQKAAQHGGSSKTQVLESFNIGHAMAELARHRQCDLIVTGTHGRSGFGRLMLGSVAEGIARIAPVPVLLVRETNSNKPERPVFRHVLATTDGSDLASDALNAARALAVQVDANLTVLHVTPDPGLPPAVESVAIDSSALRRDLELHGKGLLNEAIREVGYAKATGLQLTASGRRISDTIVQAARDQVADVIVMGTHGRTGLDRLLLGSVAEGVAHQADVPVLLVRSGQTISSLEPTIPHEVERVPSRLH